VARGLRESIRMSGVFHAIARNIAPDQGVTRTEHPCTHRCRPSQHHLRTTITLAAIAPDTATMWVSPVVRKSLTTSDGRPEVSPSTRPGNNPPGARGKGEAAARRPVRRWPAKRCTRDGAPMSVGDPRGSNTAVASSPGCGTLTRPAAVTRCVGCSEIQPGDVARTTIGELMRAEPCAVLTSTARAVKTTSDRLRVGPDDDAARCGSLVTTRTSVTDAWARASCGNGPRCTAPTRQAVAAAAPAAHSNAAVTTRPRTRTRSRRAERTARAVIRPSASRIAAATKPTPADIDSAVVALSHARPAGTRSRSSAGSPAINAGVRESTLTPSPDRSGLRTSPARCRRSAEVG